jgi:hypothetical protein
MRRLAGCLVVSLLASAAAWVGCRDDLGDETLLLLAGSATDAGGSGVPDAVVAIDDAAVLVDGFVEGGVPDAGSGEGGVPDATVPDAGSGEGGVPDAAVPDAGSGEGGVPDAAVPDAAVPDAGSGEGGPPDAAIDAGVGGDAYGGGGSGDGGGTTDDGGGRPDARRGPEIDPAGRTSFYACAGGPASAGIEVGLPIALALAIAVRRRRRWRQAGSPDRAP